MDRRFFILDVFTDRPLAGNQLAVVVDAEGLETAAMQAIAREFNFSETTFVLPAEGGGDGTRRRVRIFTPGRELDFAGHPTIGTAWVLAEAGIVDRHGDDGRVVLIENAGEVPVELRWSGDRLVEGELQAPGQAGRGDPVDAGLVAGFLGLPPAALVTGPLPCRAGYGADFLLVELADRDALGRARIEGPVPPVLMAEGLATGVFVFVRTPERAAEGRDEGVDIQARMFAPALGIAEDPATGSAAASFAGCMALLDDTADGELAWRIAQGVEMGRPSRIRARAVKRGGDVASVHVAGPATVVADGRLHLP